MALLPDASLATAQGQTMVGPGLERHLLCSGGRPPVEFRKPDTDVWVAENDARGRRLEGSALGPRSSATTVRVRNGELLVSDGPFAETKERTAAGHRTAGRLISQSPVSGRARKWAYAGALGAVSGAGCLHPAQSGIRSWSGLIGRNRETGVRIVGGRREDHAEHLAVW